MYTNIGMEDCINQLSAYHLDPSTLTTYPHLNPTAITKVISLVMNNNQMRFGEIIVKQHKGIAMGMSLAPKVANLYVSIFEAQHISANPPSHLSILRQFINNRLGIWLTDPNSTIDK